MNTPRWNLVMIHHSAGHDHPSADTQAIRRFHVEGRGWDDIGYHFLVERLGDRYEVIAGRPLYLQGAHCPGVNATAVGVCLVGDFTDNPPPQEQLLVASRLVAGLCYVFGVAASSVAMHRNLRATECPGAKFDLAHFRKLVEGYLP
jgi:N-acetylmuramoyl-L-alanine amidase